MHSVSSGTRSRGWPARCLAAGLTLLATLPAFARPEAFRVGPDQTDLLPGGKEADGIVGDFLLRNAVIEAVIGNGRSNRKPNLFVYYDGTPTPGCLYDLSLRGRNNDQLTFFAPSNLRGEVSHVRVLGETRDAEAAVEVLVASAQNQGLEIRHVYRLREGWPGLLIVTSLRNDSTRPIRFDTADRWSPLVNAQTVLGYSVGDAVDPADKTGYAFRWLETEGFVPPPETIELAPGAETTYARGIAVAESPAAALGRLASFLEGTSRVRGTLRDDQGLAVTGARIDIQVGDRKLAAYPDALGNVDFPLPFGEYPVRVLDAGRAETSAKLVVQPDRESRLDLTLGPQSRITFDIRDADGRSIPCKAQFLGTQGTPSPNLGPANRAHGCLDQYHSATGQFRVPIPPGTYDVVVTRGPEYTHLRVPVRVLAGETVPVAGRLSRIVDTRGWISTDFHNHTTESGDNTTAVDDRLVNLAA
ncbi:MAG: carboxypeptidase regulatory-like domain-containing protein, partial [Verrucomicrobiales bacterium]|nr:carboxypeptidase regulatory-like domain-containing protein [Verrucomicrobiales bacterium]